MRTARGVTVADETPESVRQRVLSEELEKGSDPRVAEGRAKAAELRARQGLPIDPDQAWRVKLEREGGAAPDAAAGAPVVPPTAAPPAPAPAPSPPSELPAAGAERPEEEVPAAEAAEAAAGAAPQAPPAVGAEQPSPAPASVAEATTAVSPPTPAPPEPAPAPEPEYVPEIGDPIEIATEGLEEIAGIKLRDPRIPVWLVAALLAIAIWAASYLLVFAQQEAVNRVGGCEVHPDRTFVCP